MRKNIILFLALAALLILVGCASITQDQAEKKSIDFVKNNVRFFAKTDNSTLGLPQYNIESISSYKDEDVWVVAMHVSAHMLNETKKGDMTVKISKSGKVFELNGKKVER